MDDETVAILENPRAPLARLRDRQHTDILRKLAEAEESPVIRLRAALSIGMRPAEELLRPSIIGQALRLEDCWRFLPQLCQVSRVIDAGSAFEAIRNLLNQREKVNLRATAARLVKLAARWERPGSANQPNAITVTQLLRLAEAILDRRQPTASSRSPVSMEPLIGMICRIATKYPTTENLIVALRCFMAIERRRDVRLADLYHDSPVLRGEVSRVRLLAAQHLEESATRVEIDDFRTMLGALRNIPIDQPETEKLVQYLFDNRARFDPAISKLLAEAVGRGVPDTNAAYPLSGGPLARIQLGTALLKAWAARSDGPSAKDSFEQIESVLGDFFAMRLRERVGEIQDYNPRLHEFALDEPPSSKVEVIRPAVESLLSPEGEVIVKALVKPARR